MEQQLPALRARMSALEDRPVEARALLDQLDGFDDMLSYQDRVRLDVLRNQVLLMEGEHEAGIAGLRALAEQAQTGGSMDLAAEVWRQVAESLAN